MTVLDRDHVEQNIAKHTVWDLPVRVFHWTLVLAVIGAFVTNKLGVAYFRYHVFCGYTVIVAVSFRVLWGLVGTYHARFINFVRGPMVALRYGLGLLKGQHEPYTGHNPLGALMVVALLGLLWGQAVLGLFGNDEIFNYGPLYGYVDGALSLVLTSWHRKLSWVLLSAVALHIGAVLFHHAVLKENLIHPMITGKKPITGVKGFINVGSSRVALALSIVFAAALILYLVISTAPGFVTDPSGL